MNYVDPSTGRTYPLTEARWCAENGHYLNLGPAPGLGRAEIDTTRHSVWRYAKALLVDVEDAVTLGEGWTPLVTGDWGGAAVLFKLEFAMPTGSFKDRGMTVMVSYLKSRGIRAGAGGLVRERGRVALGVRRAERPRVPDSRAGDRVVPEDRPDRRVRRRRRHDQGLQAGRGRGRAPAERRDLLREPQLAALLRGGREDARLRAVGAARLPGARQRGRPARLRQQRAGLRPRLRRAPPTGRDRQGSRASSASRRRTARPTTRPFAPVSSTSCPPRSPRRWPRASRRPSPRASPRCCAPCARAAGPSSRWRRRRSSRRSATWRAGASTSEPTAAAAAAGLSRLQASGAIRPGETTVLVLTGSGLKASAAIGELLKLGARDA